MSPAQSYQLQILRNPSGVALGDVSYLDNGRRRPVVFTKVGDVIDLNRVDLDQFVASLRSGSIADMVRSQALRAVPQDLSEQRMDLLAAALAKNTGLGVKGPKTVGVTAQVVMLEPGLQVAIGEGTLTPQTGPSMFQPEPGLMVASPGIPEAPAPEPLVDSQPAGVQTSPQTTGGATQEQAEAPAPAAPEAPTAFSGPVADWKAGKNLKQQEDYIKASTDVEFLTKFMDDPTEDSARLKNMAKKRLAELQKA